MDANLETDEAAPRVDAQAPCSHPLLDEAGVTVGDEVIWTPRLPITKQSPRKMRVKGIHIGQHDCNKGVPAIEVVDEKGNGFRAYPVELAPCDANEKLCNPQPEKP